MLSKKINDRMRASALVILVEDSDELLALESTKAAAAQFQPVKAISAADPEVMQALDQHRTGQGTLILCDFLRAFGTNPVAVRMLREIALQSRAQGAYSRLVLIETPGVEVPASIRGDIEFVIEPLPGIDEIKIEIDAFVKQQRIELEGNGETRHLIAAAVAGLARHEAARLFARCWIENKKLDPEWLRRQKADRVAERLGGALTFFNDLDVPAIGGHDNLKAWLGARKAAFGSEKARKFGLPEPKGMLLLGIPGTGKSLTPKVIAREWGLPLVRFDVGKVFGGLVGQSEMQMRQAIEAAESCSPCVLWVDEIEKGLAGSKGASGDSGTSQRVFGTLLTWLQEKNKPVFVVATANRISDLPPELLRKGRFDEIFFIDLPTTSERAEIVKIHLARRNRKIKEFTIDKIAEATEGFSGAEIEQAIVEAMFVAFSKDRELNTIDIIEAIKGTTPLSKTMSEEVNRLKTWANGRAKLATTVVEQKFDTETGRPIRAAMV